MQVRCKRCGFDPCVGKIPWKRARPRTLVFLPRQRNLAGCSPWSCPVGHNWNDLACFITGCWIQFPVLYSRTLFICSIYTSLHLMIPYSTPCLSNTSPPWQPLVYSLCLWFCFWFIDRLICVIFQIPQLYQWYNLEFVFLFMTSLSMIISSCLHVAAKNIISFFYMAK